MMITTLKFKIAKSQPPWNVWLVGVVREIFVINTVSLTSYDHLRTMIGDTGSMIK